MDFFLRLQGLPLEAQSGDIRYFFKDFQIPIGGVHIVGGAHDEAHIKFVREQDLLQALQLDNQLLCGKPVRLLLARKGDEEQILVPSQPSTHHQSETLASEDYHTDRELPRADDIVALVHGTVPRVESKPTDVRRIRTEVKYKILDFSSVSIDVDEPDEQRKVIARDKDIKEKERSNEESRGRPARESDKATGQKKDTKRDEKERHTVSKDRETKRDRYEKQQYPNTKDRESKSDKSRKEDKGQVRNKSNLHSSDREAPSRKEETSRRDHGDSSRRSTKDHGNVKDEKSKSSRNEKHSIDREKERNRSKDGEERHRSKESKKQDDKSKIKERSREREKQRERSKDRGERHKLKESKGQDGKSKIKEHSREREKERERSKDRGKRHGSKEGAQQDKSGKNKKTTDQSKDRSKEEKRIKEKTLQRKEEDKKKESSKKKTVDNKEKYDKERCDESKEQKKNEKHRLEREKERDRSKDRERHRSKESTHQNKSGRNNIDQPKDSIKDKSKEETQEVKKNESSKKHEKTVDSKEKNKGGEEEKSHQSKDETKDSRQDNESNRLKGKDECVKDVHKEKCDKSKEAEKEKDRRDKNKEQEKKSSVSKESNKAKKDIQLDKIDRKQKTKKSDESKEKDKTKEKGTHQNKADKSKKEEKKKKRHRKDSDRVERKRRSSTTDEMPKSKARTEPGHIIISNLPFTVTATDLRDYFSRYEIVKNGIIMTVSESNPSNLTAGVKFVYMDDAIKAEVLNNPLHGRKIDIQFVSERMFIKILESKPSQQTPQDNFTPAFSPYPPFGPPGPWPHFYPPPGPFLPPPSMPGFPQTRDYPGEAPGQPLPPYFMHGVPYFQGPPNLPHYPGPYLDPAPPQSELSAPVVEIKPDQAKLEPQAEGTCQKSPDVKLEEGDSSDLNDHSNESPEACDQISEQSNELPEAQDQITPEVNAPSPSQETTDVSKDDPGKTPEYQISSEVKIMSPSQETPDAGMDDPDQYPEYFVVTSSYILDEDSDSSESVDIDEEQCRGSYIRVNDVNPYKGAQDVWRKLNLEGASPQSVMLVRNQDGFSQFAIASYKKDFQDTSRDMIIQKADRLSLQTCSHAQRYTALTSLPHGYTITEAFDSRKEWPATKDEVRLNGDSKKGTQKRKLEKEKSVEKEIDQKKKNNLPVDPASDTVKGSISPKAEPSMSDIGVNELEQLPEHFEVTSSYILDEDSASLSDSVYDNDEGPHQAYCIRVNDLEPEMRAQDIWAKLRWQGLSPKSVILVRNPDNIAQFAIASYNKALGSGVVVLVESLSLQMYSHRQRYRALTNLSEGFSLTEAFDSDNEWTIAEHEVNPLKETKNETQKRKYEKEKTAINENAGKKLTEAFGPATSVEGGVWKESRRRKRKKKATATNEDVGKKLKLDPPDPAESPDVSAGLQAVYPTQPSEYTDWKPRNTGRRRAMKELTVGLPGVKVTDNISPKAEVTPPSQQTPDIGVKEQDEFPEEHRAVPTRTGKCSAKVPVPTVVKNKTGEGYIQVNNLDRSESAQGVWSKLEALCAAPKSVMLVRNPKNVSMFAIAAYDRPSQISGRDNLIKRAKSPSLAMCTRIQRYAAFSSLKEGYFVTEAFDADKEFPITDVMKRIPFPFNRNGAAMRAKAWRKRKRLNKMNII